MSGPTGAWGWPTSSTAYAKWPEYPLAIWDIIRTEGQSPDLIVVDGRFRVACFLASLLFSRPGTTILFDDYASREHRYAEAQNHVAPLHLLNATAVFETPSHLDLARVAAALARYCVVPA